MKDIKQMYGEPEVWAWILSACHYTSVLSRTEYFALWAHLA